jgi:hypothetical protein
MTSLFYFGKISHFATVAKFWNFVLVANSMIFLVKNLQIFEKRIFKLF